MLFQRQEKTLLTPKHVGACSPLPLPFPPRCSGGQDCTALCTLLHCGKERVREVYDASHVPEPFGADTKNQQLYWCPRGSRAMGMRRHHLQTSGDKDRAERKKLDFSSSCWPVGLFMPGHRGEDTASSRLGPGREGLERGVSPSGSSLPTRCCCPLSPSSEKGRKGGKKPKLKEAHKFLVSVCLPEYVYRF